MVKPSYIRSVALFLIMLVINLTLYSSLVLAAITSTSLDIKVAGQDGVENFKRGTDLVDIEAKAHIFDDSINNGNGGFAEITKEQLSAQISGSGSGQTLNINSFQSCEPMLSPINNQPSGEFLCAASLNVPNILGQVTVTGYLNGSNGNRLVPNSGTSTNIPLYTDDKSPQIDTNRFDVTQNPEGTFLDYSVGDDFPTAGIDRIELSEDGRTINTTPLDTDSSPVNTKQVSGRIKLASAARGFMDRKYTLKVYDKVQRETTSPEITRKIDYNKPEIIADSFGIYIGERAIHRLEPDTLTDVVVKVNVREENELDLVRANLSQINLGVLDLGCTKVIAGSSALSSSALDTSMYNCATGTVKAKIDSSARNIRVKFDLKDNKGNENAASITYELSPELSSPELVPGSFKAVINGVQVHHIAAANAKVDFEAKLREEFPGMIDQGAALDLSNIDSTNSASLKSVKADKCEFNSTLFIYSCGWNVTLEKPKKAAGIVLNAEDIAASPNKASIPISYSFEIDNIPPEARFVGTAAKTVEGMNVNFESSMRPGTDNLFIAEINEGQSGITKENVRLTIQGVAGSTTGTSGTGNSGKTNLNNLMPNDCFKKSNELYLCAWNQTEISEANAEKEYQLLLSLKDNAKNAPRDKTSKVYLDKTKPVIEQVSVMSISEQGPVEFHQSGDVLQVIAAVRDVSPVKMFVNLADLNAEENITASCVPEEAPAFNAQIKWTCTAESRQSIGVYGPEDRQQRIIGMSVFDAAGNEKNINEEITCPQTTGTGIGTGGSAGCQKLVQDKVSGAVVDDSAQEAGALKIDVLKIEAMQPAPNFWQVAASGVTASPKALDRETFELINTRQYFKININPIVKTGQTAEPLDVTFIKNSCTADETDVGKAPFSIIKSLQVQNNKGKDKTHPVLFVEYQAAKPEFNELKFTCTFSILTQLTKTIDNSKYLVQQPEFENVTFVAKWFDLPIGTIDASLRAQIEHEKKAAFDDLGKTIDVLTKVMTIAKGICQLFGTLISIMQLLALISGSAEAWRNVFPPVTTPAAGSLCAGTAAPEKSAEESYEKLGSRFCDYVSCKQQLPGLGSLLDKVENLMPKIEEGSGFDKAGQFASTITGKDAASALSIKPDPMKSLSLAVLMACIPGIIAGAEKHRQIHCMQAYCLQKDVAGGLPIDQCHAQKGLLECKYVYGEWDSLLPWNWIVDHFANIIKTIFQNPLSIIGAVVGYLCAPMCSFSNLAQSTCQLFGLVKVAGKIYKDLDAIFQFSGKGKGGGLTAMFTPQNDMCEKVKELDKKEGNG